MDVRTWNQALVHVSPAPAAARQPEPARSPVAGGEEPVRLSAAGKAAAAASTGFVIDRGTAAHTTIYLDKASFNAVMQISTFNEAFSWEEMGGDEEMRWVVIDGQRFECPRSREEIAMAKRMRELSEKTLFDYLEEAEIERRERERETEGEAVSLSLGEDGRLSFDADQLGRQPKLAALAENKKVMAMFEQLAAQGVTISMRV